MIKSLYAKDNVVEIVCDCSRITLISARCPCSNSSLETQTVEGDDKFTVPLSHSLKGTHLLSGKASNISRTILEVIYFFFFC